MLHFPELKLEIDTKILIEAGKMIAKISLTPT